MYLKFRKNFYSQNGEDGIIKKIFKELDIKENITVCEFGAWDGKYLSNVFNLVKEFNAKALMIECDEFKFIELTKTSKEYPNIIPINKLVSREGENSLDQILLNANFDKDFDLLSIDIDSYDLEVWENLKNFNPKIVIIEIDSSEPPGIKQRHDPKNNRFGSSFTSTLEVAQKKEYSLLAHTGNLIFIRKDLVKFTTLDNKFLKNPNLLFNYKIKDNVFIRIIRYFLPKIIRDRINSNLKYKILSFFN